MDKTLKFKKVSVEHGVTFIDMSNPFIQMYQEEHHVPHGFATGKLGVGHLNAFGQAVVAKELAKVIENIDKEVGLLP